MVYVLKQTIKGNPKTIWSPGGGVSVTKVLVLGLTMFAIYDGSEPP